MLTSSGSSCIARRIRMLATVAALTPMIGVAVTAQSPSLPPIHDISAPVARSADSIGATGMLIALSDGRVVINDTKRKEVKILDASLAHPLVIVGAAGATKVAYGTRGGTLLRYLGDTILFADPVSQTFHLFSPAGTFVRDVAFPSGDPPLVGNGQPLGARLDALGNLVYWTKSGGMCGDAGTQDSNAVFRVQLGASDPETVGFVRHDVCPRAIRSDSTDPETGRPATTQVIPIIQHHDFWALLPDGTIAIARDPASVIDWIGPDGTRSSSSAVRPPYAMSAADKAAFVDSMSAFYTVHPIAESYLNAQGTWANRTLIPQIIDPGAASDSTAAFTGPVRVDAANNLWVIETGPPSFVAPVTMAPVGSPITPANTPRGPFVYDVINRQGVIVDRVRVPGTVNLIGFGPGVAYVTARDGDNLQLMLVQIR
jgi:hypothetical protein